MKNLFKKGVLGLTFVFAFMLFGVNNVYARDIYVKSQATGIRTISKDLRF